ncbi:hypothetical protein Emag_000706 [Eimeria magna]
MQRGCFCLAAKVAAANRCICVAEVARRHLESKGTQIFTRSFFAGLGDAAAALLLCCCCSYDAAALLVGGCCFEPCAAGVLLPLPLPLVPLQLLERIARVGVADVLLFVLLLPSSSSSSSSSSSGCICAVQAQGETRREALRLFVLMGIAGEAEPVAPKVVAAAGTAAAEAAAGSGCC